MNIDELWWSSTLLRVENTAPLTIHLLDDRSLTRVGDAAQRLLHLTQDVKVSRDAQTDQ